MSHSVEALPVGALPQAELRGNKYIFLCTSVSTGYHVTIINHGWLISQGCHSYEYTTQEDTYTHASKASTQTHIHMHAQAPHTHSCKLMRAGARPDTPTVPPHILHRDCFQRIKNSLSPKTKREGKKEGTLLLFNCIKTLIFPLSALLIFSFLKFCVEQFTRAGKSWVLKGFPGSPTKRVLPPAR